MIEVNVKANVKAAVPVTLPSEASFQSYILQMQALLASAESTIQQLVANSEKDIDDAINASKSTLQNYVNQGNEILQDTINNKNPLAAYPVGSYYISNSEANPATLFGGGTWEPLEQGMVLLSQGTNYPAGSTGGEDTHVLTVNEMPSHGHTGTASTSGNHRHGTSWGELSGNPKYGWYTENRNTFGMGSDSDYDNNEIATSTDGNHTHDVTVGNTGGGQAHNNLPPYISVYIWRRIS